MRNILIISLLVLGGCSTVSATKNSTKSNDPIESINRKVFSFNTQVDKNLLVPVATSYKKNTPILIQSGVGNFFSNIGDIPTTINSALQGKWSNAGKSFTRLVTNSTFGIFGLIDLAGEAGIEKFHEDFGQTLGHYGIGDGFYMVLPLYGSTNLRDGIGVLADAQANPIYPYDTAIDKVSYAIEKIDSRKQYLGFEKILNEQLDPYSFVKESYYQKRKNLIYDGNPPKYIYDDDEDGLSNNEVIPK